MPDRKRAAPGAYRRCSPPQDMLKETAADAGTLYLCLEAVHSEGNAWWAAPQVTFFFFGSA